MRRAAKDPAEELPRAIEELAVTTRAAMLEAVRCSATRLIAGSYVAPGGGICPLLAAHRRGGRPHDGSTGVSAFAGVWDRYTGARTGDPRPIEQAERQMLEGLLVASLAREQRRREAAGRRERRDWEARGAVARVRAGRGARLEALLSAEGDQNRAQELARRAGWAWLGVYRRYDDYRAAVAEALNAESRQAQTASVERADAELVA
jgi:hypothetical protein